jgi:hypothetical protein
MRSQQAQAIIEKKPRSHSGFFTDAYRLKF